MSGHHHINDPSLTQNQGNMLGNRPCVRQSRLYREGCSGNAMKELFGQQELTWKTDQTEGCYGGGRVYDHNTQDNRAVPEGAPRRQQQGVTAGRADAYEVQPLNQPQNRGVTPPLQQQQMPVQNAGEQPQTVSASTGRGLRPGAGYANRQTYNIFTGQ